MRTYAPSSKEGMVAAESEAPATELEALVWALSAAGSVVFVFGVGSLTAHLRGRTRPVFRGPAGRRWWHVEHGEDESKWVLDVRLDQVKTVRFVREVSAFASFPGEESLSVRFEDGEQAVLFCILEDLYDGQRLRPERLQAWRDLRCRYGGRDTSAVVDGSLQPAAAAAA
jgi:hypothetical protein